MSKHVIIKSKTGRVYEYDYGVGCTGRKPTVHHPDFKYKEVFGTAHVPKLDPRRQCLERDSYACQMCGCNDQAHLDVHHRDNLGYSRTAHPNNGIDNLITLCDRCHQCLHCGVLDKHKDIVSRRGRGETLEAIAENYGISRQRVHQILCKERRSNN